MFVSDRIIALDIGASKLVIAEFFVTKSGLPQLINYGIGQLGIEPGSETDASPFIVSTIREIMAEYNMKPAPLFMTVSGQAVFPRYVRLPPVTRDKVAQIIRYEAEQNVPFPIAEVVWDYQLIGGTTAGQLNVMLVAVKIENVTNLTDCVEAAGMEPEIVDVAPMALYNTVRYNYPKSQGCVMVLDIGARSSNLIFIEENRIFSRSIPVAGNAINQELMKEFGLSFQDAEELKYEHAFVAFGGVYAGPESDITDRVSKIVRSVITRLHAEVNRSINFYRSQQEGGAPSLVLLTGGSSIIPHTDTFFREKLKVPVEYLNPFANVAVSEGIDADRISKDLHLLGEVTGLALRRSLTCPVEINLMPSDIAARRVFRRRQPFFILAAVGMVIIMLCGRVYCNRISDMNQKLRGEVGERIKRFGIMDRSLSRVKQNKVKARKKCDSIVDVIALRTQWMEILDALRSCMLDGMWLTSLKPVAEKNGEIARIVISGKGFHDKLKPVDRVDKTAIEVFSDRLTNSVYFSEAKIEAEPPVRRGAFDREFRISLTLKNTIKAGM